MWCRSHSDKSEMSDMRLDNCHTPMLDSLYKVKQTKDRKNDRVSR